MKPQSETEALRRAMVARRAFIAVGILALALALAVSLAVVVATRGTQQTNVPKIDNTETTLELVQDCVTPGGKCYERGQRQTADAVQSLNEAAIDAASSAAACAALPDVSGYIEIKHCVDRTLAENRRTP